MAQTKKKRRSKHRGNAAGVIESRGRTGRPPSAAERKQTDKELAAQRRRDRMMRAPTWKSATIRAGLAALVFGVLLVFAFQTPIAQAISLTAMVFLFYIPLGFYTDQFIYKRRVKSEAAKAETAQPKAKVK
jgi:drug/metabolite transporter (DMT)-like permease